MKKLLLVFILLLTACSPKYFEERINFDNVYDDNGKELSPLNTKLSLTMYQKNSITPIYDELYDTMSNFHKLVDSHQAYANYHNVYYINQDSSHLPIDIDPKLLELIKLSLEISVESNGYYNPTIGYLSYLYEPLLSPYPLQQTSPDISKALACVVPHNQLNDYIIIDTTNNTIQMLEYKDCPNIKLNLGAISKGYIIENLAKIVAKEDQSFILNGGRSTVHAEILSKEKDTFNVAIKRPFDPLEYLLILSLDHSFSLSTSASDGNYYYDDETNDSIHHLINPKTGVGENYYQSITLISNKNTGILDALSTALYSLPLDEALNMIKDFEILFNFDIAYVMVVNEDDKAYILASSSLKDKFVEINYTDIIKDIKYVEDINESFSN